MGEGDDEVTFDDAGTALDGMCSAKNGVNVVVIVRVLFQSQQAGFHFRQLLAAFLHEYAGDLIHVRSPVSLV